MPSGFIKIKFPGGAFTGELMWSGRVTLSNLPQDKAFDSWDSLVSQG